MELISPAGNLGRLCAFLPESFYRLGSLRARMRTDDVEFSTRFGRIFHDCLEPEVRVPWSQADPRLLDFELRGLDAGVPVVARISGCDGSSAGAVLCSFFPELDLVPALCNADDGWQFFARACAPEIARIAVRADSIVVDRALPWQRIIAHYFLNHVMRMQADYAFFHAATVSIGNRGVMLSGEKGAGKSTLSLALAARGHGFLGDELGTIHSGTGTMLPFPRAVSIRLGPQAQAVAHYLKHNQVERETLPDGTERLRVPVSRMFPAAAAPLPVSLTHAFFLNRVAARPQVEEFEFSWRDVQRLAPLYATLQNMPLAVRTMRLLKLFAKVRCFILSPGGTPDETADIIEAIVENKWHTASAKDQSVSVPFGG